MMETKFLVDGSWGSYLGFAKMCFLHGKSMMLAYLSLTVKVFDVIVNGAWYWPAARSEDLVLIESALCGIQPNVEQSDFIWVPFSSGEFPTIIVLGVKFNP